MYDSLSEPAHQGSCYVMKSQVMLYLPSLVFVELSPKTLRFKLPFGTATLPQIHVSSTIIMFIADYVSEQYQKLLMTAANNSEAGSCALLT